MRPVIGLAISPDGLSAFTTIEFKSLWVYRWDIATGELLHQFIPEGTSFAASLDVFAAAPTENRVLAALSDWGTDTRRDWIALWESNTGAPLGTLTGHKKTIRAVGFSADGRLAVSGGEDRRLIVWDIVRGARLHTLQGHTKAITGVAILRARPIVVSTSEDGTIRTWDLQTGRPLATHTCPTALTGVAVSRDGTVAAAAAADGALGVWNLAKEGGLDWLTGHSAPITALEMSPQADTLVSASDDKTLKLWDLATRRMKACFRAESPITCCAIVRPDVFVCGEASGAVHFVQLEPG
jgi:WD40 repeat protein